MLTVISCFRWFRLFYVKKKTLLLLFIMKEQKKGLNLCFFVFCLLRIYLYGRYPMNKDFLIVIIIAHIGCLKVKILRRRL